MHPTSGKPTPVCSTYANAPQFFKSLQMTHIQLQQRSPAISFSRHLLRRDLRDKVVTGYFPSPTKNGPGPTASYQYGPFFSS